MSDEDFNAGNYVFKSNGSTGSVINMGRITAKEGGYVALLGNSVSNQGLIAATKGTIALASGNKITLNFNGDSLLNLTIDEGTLNSLVENKEAIYAEGGIYADGGRVILTAKAADDLLSSQVNNSGIIQARTIDDLKGNIQLYAYNGTANIDGTLDASAPTTGDGGFIETSGNKVNVANTAFITTKSAYGAYGTWLIDPESYIIGEGGDMTASYLSDALANTHMEISAISGSGSGEQTGSGHGLSHNGLGPNIYVNDAVSWSANTTLTLLADNSININAPITASGDTAILILNAGKDININNAVTLKGANATLVMAYGGDYHILTKASYSGTVIGADGYPVAKVDPHDPANGGDGIYGSVTFTNHDNKNGLTVNGQTYTLIHSMDQFDMLDGYNAATGTGTASDVNGYYALAQDLDASGVTYADALVKRFNGVFTGLGHEIQGLAINIPNNLYIPPLNQYFGGEAYGGLFGLVGLPDGSGLIRDIGLENANVNINGNSYGGTLIGVTFGDVKNVYATGSVQGDRFMGGLIGAVELPNALWGQFSKTNTSTISGSFADVTVTATGYSGGLVGIGKSLTIENSHTTGDMAGSGIQRGGLIGQANNIFIKNSYALGDIQGSEDTGGLVGHIGSTYAYNDNGSPLGSIENSFATGNVSGGGQTGGLVGTLTFPDERRSFTISNTYATGDVVSNGGSNVGGLIGNVDASNGSKGSITITDSYATGDVTMTGPADYNLGNGAGGLIGHTYLNVTISDSYATGNVTGTVGGSYVGGLIGDFSNVGTSSTAASSITNSHATGNVTGTMFVGGLVGSNYGHDSSIIDSYATGNVTGRGRPYDNAGTAGMVGGLVGSNGVGSVIDGSYATGNVYAEEGGAGGLVGINIGNVSNSYAAGIVSGGPDAAPGGLVGLAGGTIENSYYDSSKNSGLDWKGRENNENYPATVTNVQGLTNAQFADIQYYLNGTIDQVLAARQAVADAAAARATADAAARQAAEEAARTAEAVFESSATAQAGQTTGQALQRDANPSRQTGAATILAGKQQPPSLDDHIIFTGSDSYSAHIKSINVEGAEFELEDKDDKK
ncbi:MAG: The GLUG motif protein [Syntrophorhabdaceae bacterium PtaU1.Bin034]|nr:MAG: The GLUG motif protein [Syntrophorhabdaceae bacterium PtaU1.Bin034]